MTTVDDLNAVISQYQQLGTALGLASNFIAKLRAQAAPQDIVTQGLLDQFQQAFDDVESQWSQINTQLGNAQVDAQNDQAEIVNVKSQLAAALAQAPPVIAPPPMLPPASTPTTPGPTATTASSGGYTTGQMIAAGAGAFVLGLGAGYMAFDKRR